MIELGAEVFNWDAAAVKRRLTGCSQQALFEIPVEKISVPPRGDIVAG
jgi:hypothetical protein